jgi:hypothetical protein
VCNYPFVGMVTFLTSGFLFRSPLRLQAEGSQTRQWELRLMGLHWAVVPVQTLLECIQASEKALAPMY